eukprot:8580581-Pyramimonas_sp.AAC.2
MNTSYCRAASCERSPAHPQCERAPPAGAEPTMWSDDLSTYALAHTHTLDSRPLLVARCVPLTGRCPPVECVSVRRGEELELHQRVRGGLSVADGAHAQQAVAGLPAAIAALLAAVHCAAALRGPEEGCQGGGSRPLRQGVIA